MRRVVIKFGGSLLDLADWPERLDAWLRTQEPAQWLLVVGCGEWGDSLRHWDERLHLGDRFCHRLCARLLTMTAELAEQVLAREGRHSLSVRRAASLTELRSERLGDEHDSRSCITVFDAGSFLLGEALEASDPLPEDWSVTTDSIAAEIAWLWPADELVLFKSCAHPAPGDWTRAADEGAVDQAFPPRAARLPYVTWVDLRTNYGV